MTRVRGLIGLAAAVVPAAVLVHLVAEAVALGRGGVGPEFVLRHAYLAALVAGSLWAFAAAVGLGHGRAEIRRRTALMRAAVARQPLSLPLLAAGNLAFFSLTQAGEGLPLLSGALWLGLAAGVAGSVIAALGAWAFGRTALVSALDLAAHAVRRGRRLFTSIRFTAAPARTPRAAYSLFVPNRPPPRGPSSDPMLLQKGTPCFSCLVRRAALPLLFSPSSSS